MPAERKHAPHGEKTQRHERHPIFKMPLTRSRLALLTMAFPLAAGIVSFSSIIPYNLGISSPLVELHEKLRSSFNKTFLLLRKLFLTVLFCCYCIVLLIIGLYSLRRVPPDVFLKANLEGMKLRWLQRSQHSGLHCLHFEDSGSSDQ